jgi:hypothetical protein
LTYVSTYSRESVITYSCDGCMCML